MIRSQEAKERALERARQWKRDNRERVQQMRRDYYNAHREREHEQRRRWAEKNPEAIRRYAKNAAPRVRDWMAKKKSERTGLAAMFDPALVRNDYQHKCWACGAGASLCMDHIIPLAQGGSNFAFNLRLLCMECNRKKNTRMDHEVADDEFRARLLLGADACMEVML